MGLIDISKTERIEHPGEAGQWVEIRALLATEMDEAKSAKMKEFLRLTEGIKTPTLPSGTATRDADDVDSRMQQLDATIVLNAAIVAWSYDAPVNPDNVKRLDSVTRDWILGEVVQRNTRPLAK